MSTRIAASGRKWRTAAQTALASVVFLSVVAAARPAYATGINVNVTNNINIYNVYNNLNFSFPPAIVFIIVILTSDPPIDMDKVYACGGPNNSCGLTNGVTMTPQYSGSGTSAVTITFSVGPGATLGADQSTHIGLEYTCAGDVRVERAYMQDTQGRNYDFPLVAPNCVQSVGNVGGSDIGGGSSASVAAAGEGGADAAGDGSADAAPDGGVDAAGDGGADAGPNGPATEWQIKMDTPAGDALGVTAYSQISGECNSPTFLSNQPTVYYTQTSQLSLASAVPLAGLNGALPFPPLGPVTKITPPGLTLQGSDTLFDVVRDVLRGLAAEGDSVGPPSRYVGGGDGLGQAALVAGSQHMAPMSRMLNNGVCGLDTRNADGIVVGLDAVDLFGDPTQASNPNTCNTSGGGLAYDGTNGQSFANYKDVLALVYGGLDNVTKTVDCNSAKRISVVNNWSSLFENGCKNSDAACNNVAHGAKLVCSVGGAPCTALGSVCNTAGVCINNTNPRLWHAFRRDDASGTSDVFASILGITPNTSASSLNGFGSSPYCNALNWDDSAANANCAAGAGKQFIGPGGVPQGFCSGAPTQACVIGAAFCDANSLTPNIGQRCDPAPAINTCGGAGLCVVSNAPCGAGQFCQPLAGDNHRRPPVNTWGDDPDPNTNSRGENDADVLPTSFQDNDPIRRTCVGTTVYSVARDGEEVCNRDGTLGLVVPVPASDFLDSIPDPNHPGQGLVEFPMNFCNSFVLGAAAKVLNCAPRNTATHQGECPSGDLTFSAGHTCEVPIDAINNTSQCQQSRAGVVGIRNRPSVLGADLRVMNLHMHDGTTLDGFVGYAREPIPTATNTVLLDFAGGFNRIHQVSTVPAAGVGHVGGCTLKDPADQIACLTHADRCSIGYAGNGGSTYQQRYANGTCAVGGAQCSLNGNPCSYFMGGSGVCVVAPQFPAAPSAPILVNKVFPSVASVQALGTPGEYPLVGKLYFNSLNFAAGVDSNGIPSMAGGTSAAELSLASFGSTSGTFGTCIGGFCSAGGAACSPENSQCVSQTAPNFNGINPILIRDGFFTVGPASPMGPDEPFCEDFNATTVCDAGIVNDNACSRMPLLNPTVFPVCPDGGVCSLPGDPSSMPSSSTTSTVCGNGIVEAFEECDPAAPSSRWTCSVPGATACSNTCRC